METPTYVALSRQTALLRQMDVVANNIANVATPGFKVEEEIFTTYPIRSQTFGAPQKLAYVQDFATARDFSQGPVTPTGNDLDVAIQGNGFFVVQTPNGPRYTRLGHFQLNAAGQIVNKLGYPVLAGGAPVTINPDDGPVQIEADGSISADRTQQGNTQVVYGKLDVVDFQNRDQLTPEEGVLFNTSAPPIQVQQPALAQRMLEQSNVLPVKELTTMIAVQRNYEAIEKFIEGEDDRMRRAVNYIIPSS
ncbi:MAG TPA: flagellar basal-body rod protein FlgF [Candidatus Cybelea sp.]|nr:flagellar basal-body rod protein FlgF [Candidatus Cybelea sp.]